jgi:hypothetical protein
LEGPHLGLPGPGTATDKGRPNSGPKAMTDAACAGNTERRTLRPQPSGGSFPEFEAGPRAEAPAREMPPADGLPKILD